MAARHAHPTSPTSRGGRHTADPVPRRRSIQPVGPVLLGVTAGAFGLVALLPSTGVDQVGPQPTTVLVVAADVLIRGVPVGRAEAAERASRARVTATAAAATTATVTATATAPFPTASPESSPMAAPTPVDPLPSCTVSARATSRYANGRIPASALCALAGHPGHRLRADAARSFANLDAAYRAAFGERLCPTDSYRSLSAQHALLRAKPHLAGRPGRSRHGFGVAVDLTCGADAFGTRTHRWLQANAGTYGWYQPRWARRDGSKPEPWHWELERA